MFFKYFQDPTLWPYTIFSNYLYLFAFESDDEQKDGNLILSTDNCNKIGDGALLRTNVFRLDMQNLRWESFSHYLSSTENSANHHLYAPYDSTAIFNAVTDSIYCGKAVGSGKWSFQQILQVQEGCGRGISRSFRLVSHYGFYGCYNLHLHSVLP